MQPLMLVGVLGSSWDDAFLEDTPSSPRDVPVKVRAALQEGVKNREKSSVFEWEGDVESCGCAQASSPSSSPSTPKFQKMLPQRLWGIKYCLHFPLFMQKRALLRMAVLRRPSYNQSIRLIFKIPEGTRFIFRYLYIFFFTMSSQNAQGGAWQSP